jgi:putative transcriptional regulator
MNTPQTGSLLIAEPFLKDPNFIRTVVLICESNADGDFGLVLNRLMEYTLDELNDTFEGFKIPLYYGGPVQPNHVHFIHQYPDVFTDAAKIADGIYWGGNFETLTSLIKSKSIDLQKIKIFLGYSGWDTNQLNEEVKENTWLIAPANGEIVFKTTHHQVWKSSLALLGAKYQMMANFPIDPQLN